MIVATLCLVLSGASAAHAASPGGTAHHGRWILDSTGRVLLLHGLNMVSKRPPYLPSSVGFGADDAAFLARNGFNVVRLGVIYGAVQPSPGSFDPTYLARIARTVHQLGARGIYTLLDFHQDQYNERFHGEGFPAWAVQDDGLPNSPDLGFPANYVGMPALQHAFDHLWADSAGPGGVGLQERYAAAWGAVARKFAGDSQVLGYDLFNEPWPGTDWTPCVAPAGCATFDAKLGTLQRKAIAAIRASDRRHLVWYEPNVLFNQGLAQTRLPDFGDTRAGMSFHDYCLAGTTAAACAKGERGAIANALARSRHTGDAVLLSEFGSTTNTSVLTRIENEADAQLMPWIEWAYCGCGDPTGSVPPSAEAVVLDPHRPPRGANVQRSTLRALERPYPRAVAGTPRRFGVSTKGVFTLRYSTARAGRGRFKAGSCTEVFVPALRYPHGYRARVRGARVISRPGAGLLELASRRGARSVSVRLTPAAHGHTGQPTETKSCRT